MRSGHIRSATEKPAASLRAFAMWPSPKYLRMSRYKPAGLSRLQVVRLALGVQFIAASTLRRISGVDFAAEMEINHRKSRQPFFSQNARS
jgi:hypothetical protein